MIINKHRDSYKQNGSSMCGDLFIFNFHKLYLNKHLMENKQGTRLPVMLSLSVAKKLCNELNTETTQHHTHISLL